MLFIICIIISSSSSSCCCCCSNSSSFIVISSTIAITINITIYYYCTITIRKRLYPAKQRVRVPGNSMSSDTMNTTA